MNGKIPHIVQYQGSKRILAPQILQYMPDRFDRLIEPFAGMAAISIAASHENRTDSFHINDLNAPLVGMLQFAIEHPQKLIDAYTKVWGEQFSYGEDHVKHFYAVRERFNNGEETPENMLYLLARCVKGAVRYGKNGNFNQSPDKRRHGTNPKTLAPNVYAISRLLNGKSTFSSLDYHEVLEMALPGDLIYMDPPYQGVSNVRDNRYFAGVSFNEFREALVLKPTMITISNQFCSGGHRVGAILSERLCIPFYGEALFAKAAKISGIDSDFFRNAEMRKDRLFANAFRFGSAPRHASLDERIFLAQAEAIRELAAQGPCILLGRGANRLLDQRNDVLKVFIYAQRNVRLGRIMEIYSLSEKNAAKKLRDADRQRASYLKAYTNQIFGRAENDHLCIDSGSIGIENTAVIIEAAYRALK